MSHAVHICHVPFRNTGAGQCAGTMGAYFPGKKRIQVGWRLSALPSAGLQIVPEPQAGVEAVESQGGKDAE